jgi:hypothetical protein
VICLVTFADSVVDHVGTRVDEQPSPSAHSCRFPQHTNYTQTRLSAYLRIMLFLASCRTWAPVSRPTRSTKTKTPAAPTALSCRNPCCLLLLLLPAEHGQTCCPTSTHTDRFWFFGRILLLAFAQHGQSCCALRKAPRQRHQQHQQHLHVDML